MIPRSMPPLVHLAGLQSGIRQRNNSLPGHDTADLHMTFERPRLPPPNMQLRSVKRRDPKRRRNNSTGHASQDSPEEALNRNPFN